MSQFGARRIVAIALAATLTMYSGCNMQQTGQYDELMRVVTIPSGNGKPVLVDGIFSPGEWDDAVSIPVPDNINLLLKQESGHLFVGVHAPDIGGMSINLLVATDSMSMTQLHVSAQLGERLLTAGADDAADPTWVWGKTTGWYANEIRWDTQEQRRLMEEGTPQQEALTQTLYDCDGVEMQVLKNKFGENEWYFMLEVRSSANWENPIIFPAGTVRKDITGWVKLIW